MFIKMGYSAAEALNSIIVTKQNKTNKMSMQFQRPHPPEFLVY